MVEDLQWLKRIDDLHKLNKVDRVAGGVENLIFSLALYPISN